MFVADDGTISSEQFQKIIGLQSTRRVQQLVQEGIVTATKVNGKYRYPFPQCNQEYIQYWESKALNKSNANADVAELEKKRLAADVTYKEAKAKSAVLELEEREGVLHSSAIVEDCFNDMIFFIRSNLLAIPGKVGIDVVADLDKYFIEKPPIALVTNLLQKEITQILNDFSSYRYDKEKMKRLTKELKTGEQQDIDEGIDGEE